MRAIITRKGAIQIQGHINKFDPEAWETETVRRPYRASGKVVRRYGL